MNNLINAGVTVSVDIPNDTYFKLFGTAVAIIVVFFLAQKMTS